MIAALACFHLMRSMSDLPVVIMAAHPMNGSNVRRVERARTKGSYPEYRDTFTKFQAARMIDFDTVVFFDADVIPLQNMDYLCDYEPSMDEAYWLKQPFGNSGTGMVMRTSEKAFEDVIDRDSGLQWPGDMDYVQQKLELRSAGNHSLISEFIPGDGVQNYFSRKWGVNASSALERLHSVHFVAGWKPWGARHGAHEGNRHVIQNIR